jgi:hypothetical protein
LSGSDDAVLPFWAEHRQQLRQSETQRSILTNIVLAIVAGLTGLMVQQKFAPNTLARIGVDRAAGPVWRVVGGQTA